jgi:hypothetical protein
MPAAIGLGAIVAARVDAQLDGGPYRIAPATVASGGGVSAGGNFQLKGTFGQVATTTLAASGYQLHSGYWAQATDPIFANGFDS